MAKNSFSITTEIHKLKPIILATFILLVTAGSSNAGWLSGFFDCPGPGCPGNQAVKDVGKTIEKGAQDTGNAAEKAVKETGKETDKSVKDANKATEPVNDQKEHNKAN